MIFLPHLFVCLDCLAAYLCCFFLCLSFSAFFISVFLAGLLDLAVGFLFEARRLPIRLNFPFIFSGTPGASPILTSPSSSLKHGCLYCLYFPPGLNNLSESIEHSLALLTSLSNPFKWISYLSYTNCFSLSRNIPSLKFSSLLSC